MTKRPLWPCGVKSMTDGDERKKMRGKGGEKEETRVGTDQKWFPSKKRIQSPRKKGGEDEEEEGHAEKKNTQKKRRVEKYKENDEFVEGGGGRVVQTKVKRLAVLLFFFAAALQSFAVLFCCLDFLSNWRILVFFVTLFYSMLLYLLTCSFF